MPKPRLNHLVVVLPGITGSVLQKDGKDLWAFSGEAISDIVLHQTKFLEDLKLGADDPNDLADVDGVCATGLIRGASLVPGFIKLFDGYQGISSLIRGRFDVIGNGTHSPDPSNLFEFPYDWRRDNRVAARNLANLVNNRLAQWRKFTLNKNAKTILLAHSMGGLVARYYLEVLEGWRNCLALVTFGTPYSGAVNTLDFLENGYKQKFLSDCLRSFTSSYQLLPVYPVINTGNEFLQVADCEALPLRHIDPARAKAAAQFHAEIQNKVLEHQKDPAYFTSGYKILPFVGTRQPTLQSLVFDGKALCPSSVLPPAVDELLDSGDGTVPRFSATPPELSGEFRETFIPEKHGSLQASPIVLNDLLARLEQMQVPKAVRGPEIATEGSALRLTLEDLYLKDEPVHIQVSVANIPTEPQAVTASLQIADASLPPSDVAFVKSQDNWSAVIPNLPAGLYKIEVKTNVPYPIGPPIVHDVFQVET